MKRHPLVSAIIIFFNAARYLEEAIESVFAQSYPHWELLLCDDGSTDGSTEMARRCARRFPETVRYLEHDAHENHGMSATRNLGIRHAKGEYIAWLDADDVWLPQKLTRQVQLMNENPEAAMVYGPLWLWFSWTGKPDDRRRDFRQDIGVPHQTLLPPPKLLLRFLQNDMYIPSGIMVRRVVLEEVGGYEEEFRDEFEDVIVHSKIGLKWPVLASQECWYKYRQHTASCSAETQRAGRERSRRLMYLHRLSDYLRTQGHHRTEVYQVVQGQIQRYHHRLRCTTVDLVRQSLAYATRTMQDGMRLARKVAERTMSQAIRRWVGLRVYGRKYAPPPGWLHFGNLRRVAPLCRLGEGIRGVPIDQYYLEQFFACHAPDIRGHVLEVGHGGYTHRYGDLCVTQADVLHIRPCSLKSTLRGNLCTGEGLEDEAFDCILLPQVLPSVWDYQAAIANAYRALKPGGVMLVTVPGCVPPGPTHMAYGQDFWRFTVPAMQRLFEPHFTPAQVEIDVHGNVLAAVAWLHGVAAHELQPHERAHRDPDYPLLITVRAVKEEAQG